jgi:hypothetical protein
MQRTSCACAAVALAGLVSAACGGSPTAPSDDAAAGRVVRGQTVSAIDGRSAANVSVQVGREQPVTTDAEGNFQVAVDGTPSPTAVFASGATVERRTTLRNGSAERQRISLIPASFDLAAFDEMFRASESGLQSWTTATRLVIVASVMAYRTGFSGDFPATSEQLTDDEVTTMIAHLREGLVLLTGGAYTNFASVEIERPAAGARVSAMRGGTIVVGRYTGVVTFAQTIGFGEWAVERDGSVTAGAMYLDRDFDRNDSRRRLLRIHELGHALGWQHVTSRTSIMNPAIGPEPTDFDRAGAVIAFERPPGNRSPDIDPESGTRPVFGLSTAKWYSSRN